MINLFEHVVDDIPMLDGWVPTLEQTVYTHAEKTFIAPISKVMGVGDGKYPYLDCFNLSSKNAYYGVDLREMLCKYLNYFNAYYDTNQSLLAAYAKIKYMIDYHTAEYDVDSFKDDIKTYILSPSNMIKLDMMNNKNYSLNLKIKTDSEVLAYTDEHGKLLMKISVIFKMLIPVVAHYMTKNPTRAPNVNEFIIDIYTVVFDCFEIDMVSKIYETATYIVNKSVKTERLWGVQAIRGIDPTLHILTMVEQIICNVIHKYKYDKNAITYNHTSLKKIVQYTVTGNRYEYSYFSHQPTINIDNEDEEDRFEDTLAKQDQALLLQTSFNYKHVMNKLELKYGPMDQDEIDFFIEELSDEDGNFILNGIQRELIFLYFYKYFGDPNGVIGNRDDYIKMMLILKKILQSTNNMKILPYVLSGKIVRSFNKTKLKKSESVKLRKSNYYPMLQNKYNNEKIMQRIDAIISTVITLKVNFISYDEPELHGQRIPIRPEILVEELLQFILNI